MAVTSPLINKQLTNLNLIPVAFHRRITMNSKIIGLTALVSAFSMANISYADVPNTFASGEPAVASEINENFSDLDSKITSLKTATDSSILTTINVDCSTDSINESIAEAGAAEHLIVNITGNCEERVLITRSGVSLVGTTAAASSSITFADYTPSTLHSAIESAHSSSLEFLNSNAVISVIGAKNIVIDNLTISGATINTTDGGAGKGIAIRYNSSVAVKNSVISGNNSGLVANAGGVAILKDNSITGNDAYGIIASDGGIILAKGGNTINQTNENGVLHAAVGAYRNGTITFSGTNTVTSTNTALDIYYGSQLRAYYGLLTVTGKSAVGYESQINLRDALHTGSIDINTKGTLRLQNRTNQTTDSVTVTGTIELQDFAVFNASAGTTVNGVVECGHPIFSASSNGTVTGGISCF
jgi:hypothetical protein